MTRPLRVIDPRAGVWPLIIAMLWMLMSSLHAASNIRPETDRQVAYGANLGWLNWRADGGHGVEIGEFWLSGGIWSSTVGWITLGAAAAPPNGAAWRNSSRLDFGVNVLPEGELHGWAYGANLGWILFTNRTVSGALPGGQTPRLDLSSGQLLGYAYSPNAGWISLNTPAGLVQVARLAPAPDNDGDGLADAWELRHGGMGAFTPMGDHDVDGSSDLDEYLAGTSPVDADDLLRIVDYRLDATGSTSTLTWTSKPARRYSVETRTGLNEGTWQAAVIQGTVAIEPDSGNTTTRTWVHVDTARRFYRVRAFSPLGP